MVLDRLDPRALARALPGGRPDRARAAAAGRPRASVRGYPARHLAEQTKALARSRLRAVAVDGKTSRGARRADGTRIHLLGVAEHGGHLQWASPPCSPWHRILTLAAPVGAWRYPGLRHGR